MLLEGTKAKTGGQTALRVFRELQVNWLGLSLEPHRGGMDMRLGMQAGAWPCRVWNACQAEQPRLYPEDRPWGALLGTE